MVVIGVAHATPYPVTGSYAAGAPRAIRAAVAGHAGALGHMDFDLGGPLLADGHRRVVDVGDLPTRPDDAPGNRELIRGAIRRSSLPGPCRSCSAATIRPRSRSSRPMPAPR